MATIGVGRLHMLIGAVSVLAAGCVVTAGVAVARGGRPPGTFPLLLCLVLIFAGISVRLQIRLGAQRMEFAWFEAALILALAEAPSAWVVLLTPIGVGLGYGCRRIAPIKILYNVSVDTFTAAVAAVVVGVAGSRHPIDVAGAVALAVAGLASGMITHVAVAGVIAVAQDTRLATAWRAGAGLQLLTAVGNVGAALVVGFPP